MWLRLPWERGGAWLPGRPPVAAVAMATAGGWGQGCHGDGERPDARVPPPVGGGGSAGGKLGETGRAGRGRGETASHPVLAPARSDWPSGGRAPPPRADPPSASRRAGMTSPGGRGRGGGGARRGRSTTGLGVGGETTGGRPIAGGGGDARERRLRPPPPARRGSARRRRRGLAVSPANPLSAPPRRWRGRWGAAHARRARAAVGGGWGGGGERPGIRLHPPPAAPVRARRHRIRTERSPPGADRWVSTRGGGAPARRRPD